MNGIAPSFGEVLQGRKDADVHVPLMPRLVVPCDTAAKACSICTSFPLGEKTVRE
jgi:hypothetical protein